MKAEETGLQAALRHGYTEKQYRRAKAIEHRIFGPYEWQNQGDRATSMVVAICEAQREAVEAERAANAEVAREHGNDLIDPAGSIAAAIEARGKGEG